MLKLPVLHLRRDDLADFGPALDYDHACASSLSGPSLHYRVTTTTTRITTRAVYDAGINANARRIVIYRASTNFTSKFHAARHCRKSDSVHRTHCNSRFHSIAVASCTCDSVGYHIVSASRGRKGNLDHHLHHQKAVVFEQDDYLSPWTRHDSHLRAAR